MSYTASPSRASPDLIDVRVPPTRADVLHQADIMEDVAIAYGFNKLPRSFPSDSGTIAQPLMINKLGDIVRLEAAMAGWSEVMPLILCSHEENFAWLNRKDDGMTAVRLANPKTAEYQVVRTSLLPGLLKTIRENKHHSLPMKVFEVSDVAFKDMNLERKSHNERHFAAAWYGKSSGFEIVHGLMDRIMLMLKSAFVTSEEGLHAKGAEEAAYWIEEVDGDFKPSHPNYSGLHADQGGDRSNILPRPCCSYTRSNRRGKSHHRRLWHSASDCVRQVRIEVSITLLIFPAPEANRCLVFRYPTSTLEINIEVFL